MQVLDHGFVKLLNLAGPTRRTHVESINLGVAPEHARMLLHVNQYVHWLGNVDLGNMFKFLALRDHSHAQIEARRYAVTIIELLRPHLPGLIGLFDELVRRDD